jgi:putative solute:sodium symporter small subunit
VIEPISSRLAEPNAQKQRSIGGNSAAEAVSRYWKTNVRIMAVLLLVWAVAGLGAGILFADALSAYRIGGFPLGFWFAQQGSILVFVVLILIYAIVMNRLDRKHHEDLEATTPPGDSP